jgi:hypothetical protein
MHVSGRQPVATLAKAMSAVGLRGQESRRRGFVNAARKAKVISLK